MHAPRALPLLLLALAGCGATDYFRSAEDRRITDLVRWVIADPVRFETEREEAVADGAVAERLASALFERMIAADGEIRAAEIREDGTARQQARNVRARCATEFVRIAEPAARICVREAGGAGPRVGVALESSSRIEETAVEAALRESLASEDARSRRAALRVLAATPARLESLVPSVLPLLSDASWLVRLEAARALRHAPDEPALREALVRGLGDDDLLVARAAALSLARPGVLEPMPPLIEFLERASEAHDPHAIAAALEALRRASGRRDLPPDAGQWRSWLEQSRPIDSTVPAESPSRGAGSP